MKAVAVCDASKKSTTSAVAPCTPTLFRVPPPPLPPAPVYRTSTRALKHGDLPEDERRKVKLIWLMQCVRGSEHILRREGIDVPREMMLFGADRERPENIAGYRVR